MHQQSRLLEIFQSTEMWFYVPINTNTFRLFWSSSSQPISWLSTKKLKQTQQK